MAATLFDAAAAGLEQHTDLDRLEARGTLRITLRESGLAPDSLTLAQLQIGFAKIMPEQLEKRAVPDGASVCRAVMDGLSVSDHGAAGSSTDEIFSRLGGD